MMEILAFFAHPDDETMLCGGLLARLAKDGARVHYLCATRGEGGEVGEPPLCTRAELGWVRQHELECAVEWLGAASLAFLDYVDPTVGPDNTLYPFAGDVAVVAAQVRAAARKVGAEFILTHGSNGEYGHPAHVLAHQAARLAVTGWDGQAPALYTIQAIFPGHPKPRLANASDPAHLVVDITPVLDLKLKAALCHRTQHALFIRNAPEGLDHPATVADTLMPVESLHRAFPPVSEDEPGSGAPVLEDALAHLLRPYAEA